jgi:hypothetical protein
MNICRNFSEPCLQTYFKCTDSDGYDPTFSNESDLIFSSTEEEGSTSRSEADQGFVPGGGNSEGLTIGNVGPVKVNSPP